MEEDLETRFAQELRALRHKRAMTQSELARRSGLSRRTLSYWETGQTQPRVPELQAVLAALAATPDEAAPLISLLTTPRSLRLAEERLEANAPAIFTGADIGDLLRAMRLRRGMTQEELAHRLRINRLTVVKWETLRTFPSEESLEPLPRA